jgi:hypothetical protein
VCKEFKHFSWELQLAPKALACLVERIHGHGEQLAVRILHPSLAAVLHLFLSSSSVNADAGLLSGGGPVDLTANSVAAFSRLAWSL